MSARKRPSEIYATVCRHAAHNKQERLGLYVELSAHPSPQRKKYLQSRLNALDWEKRKLVRKESELSKFNYLKYEFII